MFKSNQGFNLKSHRNLWYLKELWSNPYDRNYCSGDIKIPWCRLQLQLQTIF